MMLAVGAPVRDEIIEHVTTQQRGFTSCECMGVGLSEEEKEFTAAKPPSHKHL